MTLAAKEMPIVSGWGLGNCCTIEVGPGSVKHWQSTLQVTFHRSRVQVTAPLINYQTTQIPLYLIQHLVKILGLGDTFNAVHLSVSW